MAPAHSVEAGFFPLDDELDLPTSGLTPHAHQALVLLGTLLPFAKAATHLHTLLKVQVSPSTARRLTEAAAACLEQWQDQQAQPSSAAVQRPQEVPARLAMATDGVLIAVRPNEWTEVKMTTIGEVTQPKKHGEAHCEQLSYFARLSDAATFADSASGEIKRRGVEQAQEVAAINDGAEWIPSFVHSHRADALRILDASPCRSVRQ